MAEGGAADLTSLPIESLPEVPLPEIVPLKRKDVQIFLAKYGKVLNFVESWVEVSLKAMSTYPRTPTPELEDLVTEWDGMAINDAKDMCVEELERSRDSLLDDTPVLTDDPYFDEDSGMDLLEPARRKEKGSFFKRFLKWPKKQDKRAKEEDVLDIEELEMARRKKAYEPLKLRFIEILEKEIKNHEKEKPSKVKYSAPKTNTPVHESSEDTKWIDDMTQRIKICHMIFRVSRELWKTCKDEYDMLKFEPHESQTHFEHQTADRLNRNIYNLTYAKTLSLMAIFEVESQLLSSEKFEDCLHRFEQERRRERKSKVGKDELTIVKRMSAGQSVLDDAEDSPRKGKAYEQNMKKSPSNRELIHDTDDVDDFTVTKSSEDEAVDTAGKSVSLQVATSSSGTTPDSWVLFNFQTSSSSQSPQSKQASEPQEGTPINSPLLKALLEEGSLPPGSGSYVYQPPVTGAMGGTMMWQTPVSMSITPDLGVIQGCVQRPKTLALRTAKVRKSPRKRTGEKKGSPLKGSPKQAGEKKGSPLKGSPKRAGGKEGSPLKGSPKRTGGKEGSPLKGSPKRAGGKVGSTVKSPPKRAEE